MFQIRKNKSGGTVPSVATGTQLFTDDALTASAARSVTATQTAEIHLGMGDVIKCPPFERVSTSDRQAESTQEGPDSKTFFDGTPP